MFYPPQFCWYIYKIQNYWHIQYYENTDLVHLGIFLEASAKGMVFRGTQDFDSYIISLWIPDALHYKLIRKFLQNHLA